MGEKQTDKDLRRTIPGGVALDPRVIEAMARGVAALVEAQQRIRRIVAVNLEDAVRSSLPALRLVADQIPKLLASLPPNIRALGPDLKLGRMEEISLAEGLQFGSAIPTAVARELLKAETAGERRAIVRRRSRAICRACMTELDAVTTTELGWYVRTARRSAEALLAGHREASQALSTNLLDTLIDAKQLASRR